MHVSGGGRRMARSSPPRVARRDDLGALESRFSESPKAGTEDPALRLGYRGHANPVTLEWSRLGS